MRRETPKFASITKTARISIQYDDVGAFPFTLVNTRETNELRLEECNIDIRSPATGQIGPTMRPEASICHAVDKSHLRSSPKIKATSC